LAAIDVLFGLPVTHHREVAAIFQAITPDEVKAAAATLLGNKPVVARVLPRDG
jgi:predicted Zn-dependent peptidase